MPPRRAKPASTRTTTVDVRRAKTVIKPKLIANRFRVMHRIGAGGMGVVYEVHDVDLDERVALKMLSGRYAIDAIARLRDEVRLARRITHPNVVRIFDLGEEKATHYFTMELVSGEDLAHRMRGHALPKKLALGWARQVALALEAAHGAGVIHRDLKPSNVLIAGDRAVVTDFGIARPTAAAPPQEVSGTPEYMSPEQRRGEREDVRTDLWSFGVMLYEMLHGALPTEGKRPKGDDLASRLIRQCLERNSASRPTASQALAMLTDALAPAAVTLAAPVTASGPPLERRIAVLPARVLAGEMADGVLEALNHEMIDALAHTRGLQVAGPTATLPFATDRDPRRIGRELKVDAVVDITLSRRGDRVRVDAHLLDATTGFQLWSERLEDTLGGMLALQEALAARIAEQLRVGIDAMANRGTAPALAIELYLRARSRLNRYHLLGSDGAIALLEQAVALAPRFPAAAAALATAKVRASFSLLHESSGSEAEADAAVQRCLELGPQLPEAQLAAATLAVHRGQYAAAVRGCREALLAAPTYAAAHELLANIEGDAGRVEQAIRRARHALELDTSLSAVWVVLATRLELTEGRGATERELARFGGAVTSSPMLELRLAMWRRDQAALDRLSAAGRVPEGAVHLHVAAAIASGAMGIDEGRQRFAEIFRALAVSTVRRRTFVCQMFAEAFGSRDAVDPARVAVAKATEAALLDLVWLERCPALACLRGDAGFEAHVQTVRGRVKQLWAEVG